MAEISHQKGTLGGQLGAEALEGIAAALSDLYFLLYEERPGDARASLTGNLLAYVFEGGLSTSDEWLLRSDRGGRLSEFRRSFFEVVDDEMTGVVGDLTGMSVGYSFYGFDSKTRTSHAIFVLDMTELGGSEQRRAVLNWSEQVRRNARRLREQHRQTREAHRVLTDQVKAKRQEVRREVEADDGAERSDDP